MRGKSILCVIAVFLALFAFSTAFAMPAGDNNIPVYVTLKDTGEEKLMMLSPMELKGLAASGNVEKIRSDAFYYPMLNESVPIIKADAALSSGFDGAGVKICIIDSGIDFFHQNLPQPYAIADFTGYIDGLNETLVNGTVKSYFIKITQNNTNMDIFFNWIRSNNKFDLYIYNSSGSLINSTTGLTVYNNTKYGLWGVNVSLRNVSAGIYNFTVNNTIIGNTSDYPSIYYGYWASGYIYANQTIVSNDYELDGHGTHVAGIIFSNNTTYQGVAPNASMVIAKACAYYGVMNTTVCWTSSAASGISWCSGQNVSVVSMSLGGTAKLGCNTTSTNISSPYYGLDQNVDSLVASGILPVIAAGNSGPNATSITSPGCARKVLTVGNVDKSRTIASSSSRGPTNDTFPRLKPEIVAPGENIYSTYPVDTFAYMSGTSMSTPHVAGVAALVKQAHPTWTAPMLKVALMNSANQSTLGQVDNDYGYGLVDALEATNFTYVSNKSLSNSTNNIYTLNITSNTTPLKVTIYWEESWNENHNRIYLNLSAPNGTVVSSSTDTNNTIQQVVYGTPDIGTWTVTVIGNNISNGKQVYAATNSEPLKPNVTLVGPSGTIGNQTINFTYTPFGYANLSNCALYTNSTGNWIVKTTSANITNNTVNNFTISNFNDSTFDWTVWCNDTAGLSSFAPNNLTLTIDRSKPVITIVLPNASVVYTTSSTEMNVTINETNISHIWWSIDAINATPIDLLGNLTYNDTINWSYPGSHNLIVYANDTIGNIGNATTTFYSNASTINFTSWINDLIGYTNISNVEIWSNGTNMTANESANLNTTFNITFQTANFNTSILNINGTTTGWSALFSVFENSSVISTLISTLGSNATKLFYAGGMAYFSNSTGQLVTSATNFTDIFYCTTDTNCTRIGSCTFYNGTACYYNTSANVTVFVPHFSAVVFGNDTVAPTISIVTPVNTTAYTHGTAIQDLTARLTTSIDTTYCNYTINGSVTVNSTNTTSYVNSSSKTYLGGNTTYLWNIGPLKNGTYNISFTCKDNSTNIANAALYRFIINDTIRPLNNTAPSASALATSAVIDWWTSEKTNATVGYGTSSSLGFNKTDITFVEYHYINISALAASTTYYYKVWFCDYQGNCGESVTRTFTTSAETQDASQSDGGGGSTSSKIVLAFGTVDANSPTTINLNNINIAIKRIEFTLSNTTDNVRLEIESFGNRSTGKIAPGTIYQYFSITSYAFTNNPGTMKLKFEVPKSWFTNNSINPDTLKLYHYMNGSWTEEPITKTGSDPYTYEITLKKLSMFAISAQTIGNESSNETCGDDVCAIIENCTTCPADCGSCTNETLNQTTNQTNITCGNGVCGENETCKTCSTDCGKCPILPKINLPKIDIGKYWMHITLIVVFVLVGFGLYYIFFVKKYKIELKIEKPRERPKKHLQEWGIRKIEFPEIKTKKVESVKKTLELFKEPEKKK